MSRSKKEQSKEQQEVVALKTIFIQSIPIGTSYHIIMLVLTEMIRDCLRLWLESSESDK